jgi:hypothetical protein
MRHYAIVSQVRHQCATREMVKRAVARHQISYRRTRLLAQK